MRPDDIETVHAGRGGLYSDFIPGIDPAAGAEILDWGHARLDPETSVPSVLGDRPGWPARQAALRELIRGPGNSYWAPSSASFRVKQPVVGDFVQALLRDSARFCIEAIRSGGTPCRATRATRGAMLFALL